MTAFDLDKACAQATARLAAGINRSAGQHLRAMRASNSNAKPASAPSAAPAPKLPTARAPVVDQHGAHRQTLDTLRRLISAMLAAEAYLGEEIANELTAESADGSAQGLPDDARERHDQLAQLSALLAMARAEGQAESQRLQLDQIHPAQGAHP